MNESQPDAHLRHFLDSLFVSIEPVLSEAGQRRVFDEARTACATVTSSGRGPSERLSVCSWFDTALKADMPRDPLNGVAEGLRSLEPHLSWRRREDATGTGSASFADGHANALIVGPGGLAERTDVWVGLSLLAPNVRYPDHTHPPEELYLVLSDGEFRNAETDWRAPGIGGLFHNPPGIVHAMRSLDGPLLAVWMLVPAAA